MRRRGPGSCQLGSSRPRLVEVLKSRIGPIFSGFLTGRRGCTDLVVTQGARRTPWASLLWESETAPHPLRERVNPPLRWSPQYPACSVSSPTPCSTAVLYRAEPGLHNTAHFRKAYFDRGIGTNTVAADTDEKQTAPCANREGREKNNPGALARPLARSSTGLSSYRSGLARLCLRLPPFQVRNRPS